MFASSSEATVLAVFVDRVADPIDARIVADGSVERINENDLEVLVRRVLVDPVRTQHTQVTTSLTDALFAFGTNVALELDLFDTLVGWLTQNGTFVVRLLAATTADTDTVDNITLFSFVS